jgi:uncharacterized membrane protein YphA (DoxX/SURF4 family)
MRRRIKGVMIGLAIALAAMPIAVVVTIAALPVWSWLEAATGIESIGHSGPAEWCYLVTYLIVAACGALLWSRKRRRAGS